MNQCKGCDRRDRKYGTVIKLPTIIKLQESFDCDVYNDVTKTNNYSKRHFGIEKKKMLIFCLLRADLLCPY